MFCPKCGTSNQDEANFCYKCGMSFSSKEAERTWYEVGRVDGAQIKSGMFERTFHFWIDAVGPKGNYFPAEYKWTDAAFHRPIPDGHCKKCTNAYDAFIQQLINDNWEPFYQEGEQKWYQRQYRRKVSSG